MYRVNYINGEFETSGSLHIRAKPENVEKTAFNAKYGQFEYIVMPSGVCNAPATFQTLMNQVFHDYVDDIFVVYLDDCLQFG